MKDRVAIILFSVISITGCEEQPVQIPPFQVPTTNKVVLLEELTGVKCPNCPAGTEKVESLLEIFGENLASYSVHGSFLTTPTDQSQYDFRNPFAIDLENSFKPFLGKPAAVIDRKNFDGQDFLAVDNIDQWQSLVEEELNRKQVLQISSSHAYEFASRLLSIDLGISALEDLNGNLSLSIVISESHIIDAQLNVSEIIPDFEHNHVLRTMLTNFDGDQLINGMTANQTLNRSYSYTLPEEIGLWIPENLEVIVFVTDASQEGQVIQAHKFYVIE